MPKAPLTDLQDRIEAMIAGDIAAGGYDLLRAQILGGGRFQTLQLMAERKDGGGITVEDCAKISRAVMARLEAEPALADRFTLEVSSPGIDRPLLRAQDYRRFQGHVAKVELARPLASLRKFEGRIVRISEGEAPEVAFQLETEEIAVPLGAIARARLVITPELLAQGRKPNASQ